MFKEIAPSKQNEKIDFRDSRIITKILEDGIEKELEDLKNFYNIKPEEIAKLRHYALLRKKAIKKSDIETNLRIKNNPKATKYELYLGCYIETLEPQVRKAVVALQKKGYSTYDSGFDGFNSQGIHFNKNYLVEFKLPENLITELKKINIELEIKPNYIGFTCNDCLRLSDLEKIWKKIISVFPDLKEKPEPSKLEVAEDFRKKQKNF